MKIFIDKKTLDKLKNGWPVCDVYMPRHKPESKYGNYIEVNLSESTQEPDLLKDQTNEIHPELRTQKQNNF